MFRIRTAGGAFAEPAALGEPPRLNPAPGTGPQIEFHRGRPTAGPFHVQTRPKRRDLGSPTPRKTPARDVPVRAQPKRRPANQSLTPPFSACPCNGPCNGPFQPVLRTLLRTFSLIVSSVERNVQSRGELLCTSRHCIVPFNILPRKDARFGEHTYHLVVLEYPTFIDLRLACVFCLLKFLV